MRPLHQVTCRPSACHPPAPKCSREASVLSTRRSHSLDQVVRPAAGAEAPAPVRTVVAPSSGAVSSPLPVRTPKRTFEPGSAVLANLAISLIPSPPVVRAEARSPVGWWMTAPPDDEPARPFAPPGRNQVLLVGPLVHRSRNPMVLRPPGPATSFAAARPVPGPKPFRQLADNGRFPRRYGSSCLPLGSIRRRCRGADPGCRTKSRRSRRPRLPFHRGRNPAVPSGPASVLVGNRAIPRRLCPLPKHRVLPPGLCPAGRGRPRRSQRPLRQSRSSGAAGGHRVVKPGTLRWVRRSLGRRLEP